MEFNNFNADEDYNDSLNYWLENITYDTTNSSHDDNDGWCDSDKSDFIKMFQACVFCLIFLLGVVGNSLVIATFALYRSLRLRSMTDIFLFHLALADLLLLLTLPLQAVDTNMGWIFPVLLCKATRASYAINTYSGLLLLACISVDRYMVVVQAQKMLRLRSQILTCGKVAAVGVWLVAVLLSLPEIIFSGVLPHMNTTYCGMIKSGGTKLATNGAIIAVFCLSFLVMVTCYSLIACVLCEGHANRRRKQWNRQRTLKLMVALVLVFLLFQLPYTVVLLRKMAGQFCNPLLEYVTCTLAYTRCCLNPILYALVGVRFRNDVLRLVRNSSCSCGLQQGPQSPSALSVSSPTLPDRSFSSCETATPVKFQFPASK